MVQKHQFTRETEEQWFWVLASHVFYVLFHNSQSVPPGIKVFCFVIPWGLHSSRRLPRYKKLR